MLPAAALLALADSRLPSGAHVHSGGMEQAVAAGLVRDDADLAALLRRRLHSAGAVAAGIAAAAVTVPASLFAALDAAADARIPSQPQRAASRAQGRGFLRTARAAWPAPRPDLPWTALGPRPHHPIVLGCAAGAAGVDALGVATAAAYLAVTGPATAAQRLLGLDPVAVAATTLALSAEIDEVAAAAATAAEDAARSGDLDDLPDPGDPLADLLAAVHADRGDALFAS